MPNADRKSETTFYLADCPAWPSANENGLPRQNLQPFIGSNAERRAQSSVCETNDAMSQRHTAHFPAQVVRTLVHANEIAETLPSGSAEGRLLS